MSYASTKAVLSKGLSFPLKRSALDTALASGGLGGAIHHVYFERPRRAGLVLWVDYGGEGQKGWHAAGRSGLWIFAVASSERRKVEDALITHGIPVVVDCLTALSSAGNVIRGNNQVLELSYSDGSITTTTSCEGLLTRRFSPPASPAAERQRSQAEPITVAGESDDADMPRRGGDHVHVDVER